MSRIYQNVILQLKDLYNRKLGVIDTTGNVTACTYGILDAATVEHILEKYADPAAFYSYNGYTYKPVGNRNKLDFITSTDNPFQSWNSKPGRASKGNSFWQAFYIKELGV